MPFTHSNAHPHDVLWFRDEHGHPQQTARVNGEEAGWKPMTEADFNKTFPVIDGDESEPAK
jgi:hypothetical protein